MTTTPIRCVDLFAGWGGFSLGAEAAGARVVWAANHWQLSVDVHQDNHPRTAHVCQDLRQADWTTLPRFDVMLAAPACQGHSQASQPKRRRYHDAMRATAWAVVDCAEVTQPAALIVENVPDFQRWQLYPLWRQSLELLGYTLTTQIVRASHHGVPQRRDRLFVVGMRNGRRPAELDRQAAEPAIGPCIEWGKGKWRNVASTTPKARERITRGRARLGRRFLTQHVTNHPGVGLDEPIRTITTKDQWAIVDGSRYRPLTLRETARAMGFPETFKHPTNVSRVDAVRGFGNAVCPPVGAALVTATQEAM